jgi:hypothetical protein
MIGCLFLLLRNNIDNVCISLEQMKISQKERRRWYDRLHSQKRKDTYLSVVMEGERNRREKVVEVVVERRIFIICMLCFTLLLGVF